jgi:hypothetical protein
MNIFDLWANVLTESHVGVKSGLFFHIPRRVPAEIVWGGIYTSTRGTSVFGVRNSVFEIRH